MQGGTGRKFETKSDKKGEFIQLGLPSGSYTVVAEKDKMASPPSTVRVTVSSPGQAQLIISAAGASMTKEGQAKNAELKKLFDEGVAAAGAGNHDQAVEKFTAAAALNTNCYDCYYNIGFSYAQKKDYDKAEVAYKKAIELKPDYGEAYSGLSNIYNAQRKFDLAAEAAAKATQGGGGAAAAGGGNADSLYNQGVILWNAGKIPDAKKQFEAAIAANPNHAESHYQLGMALVNEGNMAGAASEFETYLKLAPSGPNAATAQGLLAQLKK
jgi:tetratricopeptide (TPR) repeat protein